VAGAFVSGNEPLGFTIIGDFLASLDNVSVSRRIFLCGDSYLLR
jgi:hypothetical protein